MSPPSYNPREFKALTYHDATSSFGEGTDSPRACWRDVSRLSPKKPSIMAFPAMNEAGARGSRRKHRRWQASRQLSPIDGIPIGIKDLLETKDMPSQMGCDACTGNFPKCDNAAVWALREAGAVVLCKTVTAELGGSHPGPTRNPFDLSRTPGGSSSGSAAAAVRRLHAGRHWDTSRWLDHSPAAYCREHCP